MKLICYGMQSKGWHQDSQVLITGEEDRDFTKRGLSIILKSVATISSSFSVSAQLVARPVS